MSDHVARLQRAIREDCMDNVHEDRLFKLATQIDTMLQERAAGTLKRTADDFISGLIKAYAVMIDEDDVGTAMDMALGHARSGAR